MNVDSKQVITFVVAKISHVLYVDRVIEDIFEPKKQCSEIENQNKINKNLMKNKSL